MIAEPLRSRLRTVHFVPLTAYGEDGSLALEPMRRHARRLLRAGARVAIPCAGSAEFHTLLASEIERCVALWREEGGAELTLIAPVGLQLPHALDTGRRALAQGADALMVMPPVGPYLSDAGLRDYYLRLIEELEAPVVIYKKGPFPGHALLLELVRHPLVVAVKHAGEDIDAFRRVVLEAEGAAEWICGSAERYAPFFMLAGAAGYTSGAGNICPRLTLALHRALSEGRWDEAWRLNDCIRPIEDYRARCGGSYNVSFLKHAVRRVSGDFGPPRPPLRRLTPEEEREIDALIEPILARERELEAASYA